jgi:hypothetical protein
MALFLPGTGFASMSNFFAKVSAGRAIIAIVAIALLALVAALVFRADFSELHLTVYCPLGHPEYFGGDVVRLYHFDGTQGVADARAARDDLLNSETLDVGVANTLVGSRGGHFEREIVLDGPRADCRVKRGTILIVLLCKGYGWQVVVEVDGDTELTLDRSNVGRGYGGVEH